MPVVKRHHLLLVTLLLANAAAVEAMPIIISRVVSEIIAVVISVTAVLIFGEVLPQAICSRYGLAIGYYLLPLVWLLMVVFFVVSWPISKLLDCMLGSHHRTFFRRAEIKALLEIHGSDAADGHMEEKLSSEEILIIKGAMELQGKVARDAMIPLESTFMLSDDVVLNKATMEKMLIATHSRIPVYRGNTNNVVGILLTKMLMAIDPKANIKVKDLFTTSAIKPVFQYPCDMPLYSLLKEFQSGKGHLFLLTSSEDNDDEDMMEITSTATREEAAVVGIITLEDVLEELLCEEIIDETDVYVDVHKRIQVARAKMAVQKEHLPTMSRRPSFASSTQSHRHQASGITRSSSSHRGRPYISQQYSQPAPMAASEYGGTHEREPLINSTQA